MSNEPKLETDLASIRTLRALMSPEGAAPFKVAILIGPGFIPMDMVGAQAVFGLAPGAEIHLVWKTLDLVEGFPGWWTRPTTAFAECPHDLDVFVAPMLPPEVQNDPEVLAFVADRAAKARYVMGVCNGVLLLGAVGLLRGRRATSSHNALPVLPELGVSEAVPSGAGVVVDGNVYTAGPGIGGFEASMLIMEEAFGRAVAELAALIIEYDPHPPFGAQAGTAAGADPANVAKFEGLMAGAQAAHRSGATANFKALTIQAECWQDGVREQSRPLRS